MAETKVLRVFISSPSDVRPERLIAERVVQRLSREFAYHFRVEPVLWEREPLTASHHFQEQITPPRETDIVVVILWSRLGVPLPTDKFLGPLTGKPVTGTEWEFEDALKGHRARKLPDLLMYRKRTPVTGSFEDEEAVRQQLAQKHLVEEFIKSWFIDQDAQSFNAAFREFTEASAFEELLETHLRELLRKRLAKPDDALVPVGIRWHQGSPFRGLLSFELEHASVFFGRTRARNELRELLARQVGRGSAFVLVVGASGSGKSSLVKAGLLADLKLQGMVGRVALVRHAVLRPSDRSVDLLEALAAAMMAPTALPELASLQCDLATLKELLRSAPAQAKLPIRQGLAAAGQTAGLTEIAEARLLVVVDQLEELFTLDAVSPPERDAFVAALEALAASGLVWVIATMRSDFFDRLETQPRLLALSGGEARYVLAPPEPAEIAQIISQPAREAGLRFEVDAGRALGLDEVIRQAAAGDAGALPLLSFLLDQLWQRRSDTGTLTFAAYAALGGLEGALGRRAEEVFAVQPAEVQAALPAILRALVTVGHGAKATVSARSAPLSMFPAGSPARALVTSFLHPEARLLVADGFFESAPTRGHDARDHDDAGTASPHPGEERASAGDPRGPQPGVDGQARPNMREAQVRIAHEALLSHWPRAKDQIAADSRDLELLGRLEQGTGRWQAAEKKDRDSLVLPRGLPLTEALALARRWGAEMPAGVTEFIRQSRRAARRRLQRLALALAGAVASVPIVAALVWAVMVWSGVRAVEQDLAFVAIPAGCFTMGSPPDETLRFDHEAQHKVCVPAFELGKFAVTQAQWRRVMVENADPARYKGDRNPVEMVSWYDARAFAWRMSFFGQHHYRLPSEAEWEYAARAGTTTPWFWGNKLENGCAYANLRDRTYASKHFNVGEAIIDCEDDYDYTAPVGSFKPNQFGLYDMIGNVYQWTEDCFGDYANAPVDGSAAAPADCRSRVERGGSWTAKPSFTRSASRDTYAPENRNDVVGFRLAR
jgi:formylglycine-generating enzyme required for sulfatase activity